MIYSWQDVYRNRLIDAKTALSSPGSEGGARVFIGSACGEPQLLVKTLIDLASNLADTEILHFLDLGHTSYTDEKYNDRFRHNALFIRRKRADRPSRKAGRIIRPSFCPKSPSSCKGEACPSMSPSSPCPRPMTAGM